ncbi:class I SAM-dependent rRNA methyltransferase [Thiobacter aerophilum]|uniref:Class I SAM-dependent methyltransferase n=1 Tax=Thiobacter aerophilum TaxID=3121275 RepID=A0ABV0EFB6_9BURK
MTRLILKPGRDKSLRRRHPWIFSGAVARVVGSVRPGDTVAVEDDRGAFLAWAAYNPRSQICARVWSFDAREEVDEAFFYRRVTAALAARDHPDLDPNFCRVIHGEADGLPGVIADRYGDTVVVQLSTAGADAWRETIADALMALPGVARVFERSDLDVRALEGLAPRVGVLRGDAPPEAIEIVEAGVRFLVDVHRGHKTGFYLDQRVNRQAVGRLAQGRRVLNCFCYTGGFTLHALAQGATHVTSIDSAGEALAWGQRQLALNGFDAARVEWVEGDVFRMLRAYRDAGRRFDLIVLDPPKFAPTAAQVEKAARGYKDINWLALRLLAPGGWLATFSCSGGVSEALFQKIVAGAALDAGVEASIVARFHQSPDHPVRLSFPEGGYLKGLLCRVP